MTPPSPLLAEIQRSLGSITTSYTEASKIHDVFEGASFSLLPLMPVDPIVQPWSTGTYMVRARDTLGSEHHPDASTLGRTNIRTPCLTSATALALRST
jgi:hypothetical protein